MNVRRPVHGMMLFIAFISITALSFFQGAAIKDYEPMKHCYQQVGNIPCEIPSLKEYKPYCIYPPAITNRSNGTENPLIDKSIHNNQTFINNFAHYSKQYTLLRVEFFRRITENCGDDSVYEQLKKDGELKNVIDYFDKIQSCYQKLQRCQTALVYSDNTNSTRYELGSLNADLFTDKNTELYEKILIFEHRWNYKTSPLLTVIDGMLYTIFNLSNMCMSYDQKLRNENENIKQYIDLDLSVYHILQQFSIHPNASELTEDSLRAGNANIGEIIDTLQSLMRTRYNLDLKLKNE